MCYAGFALRDGGSESQHDSTEINMLLDNVECYTVGDSVYYDILFNAAGTVEAIKLTATDKDNNVQGFSFYCRSASNTTSTGYYTFTHSFTDIKVTTIEF